MNLINIKQEKLVELHNLVKEELYERREKKLFDQVRLLIAEATLIEQSKSVAVEPVAVEPVAVEPVAVEPVAVEPVYPFIPDAVDEPLSPAVISLHNEKIEDKKKLKEVKIITKNYTLEEVQTLSKDVAGEAGITKVIELLEPFKTPALSKLAPEHYPAVGKLLEDVLLNLRGV